MHAAEAVGGLQLQSMLQSADAALHSAVFSSITLHTIVAANRASIEYKIKADCDQVGLLKPDFKKTIKIEVLQQHKAAAAPVNVAAEEPISIFCCFNKGLVGLRVTADTDSYMPGEQIGLRAQVRQTQ